MELDIKNFFRSQNSTFGAWGLKTSLRQFGPAPKGLINPLVNNTSSNFHKESLDLGPGASAKRKTSKSHAGTQKVIQSLQILN